MKLFSLSPDKDSFNNYEIDAQHYWGIPGIKCSNCGHTWSITGIAYPSIYLPSQIACEYETPRAVMLNEYNDLQNRLQSYIPNDLYLQPGTEFGPLKGEAMGTFGNFVWTNSWTLLIEEASYYQISGLGINLPKVVQTKIETKVDYPFTFLEFQIEVHARLDSKSFIPSNEPKCVECGHEHKKIDHIVIEEKTIPTNQDLFRPIDAPSHIIATERFVESVKKFGFTNVIAKSVEIS